jgi:predicted aminopeptidase
MLTRRRFAQTLLLLSACLLLPGCYIAQAVQGQLRLLSAREPIDRLLARADTSVALRAQLEQARRIRDFATQALGLPDNASYRSYADIHRDYVVWNVVAAPVLSLTPRRWCFPVAGCVSYRGYFSAPAAEKFAERLRRHGDDVVVGGVPAYSTLGHFSDPLVSSMARYGEYELAALEFHELAHQVAYLKGDSSYNEAFATTVEEEGVARYAAARGEPAQLARYQLRRAQRQALAQRFAARRAQLQQVYAGPLETAAKLAQKHEILGALGEDIRALERSSGQPTGYGPWIQTGLNNAHLASVATYYDQIPQFEALLVSVGGDLPAFYAAVKAQIRHKKAPQAVRLAGLQGGVGRPPAIQERSEPGPLRGP